jgi:hypothetical protein
LECSCQSFVANPDNIWRNIGIFFRKDYSWSNIYLARFRLMAPDVKQTPQASTHALVVPMWLWSHMQIIIHNLIPLPVVRH